MGHEKEHVSKVGKNSERRDDAPHMISFKKVPNKRETNECSSAEHFL